MPIFKIHAFGKTDRGLVNSINEDSLLIDNKRHLYAVADGVGGLPKGDLASSLAIAQLAAISEITDLEQALAQINSAVYQKALTIPGELGMGTTLTVVHIAGDSLYLGHVGDSGVILCDQNRYQKLTSDHTMAERIRSQLKPGQEGTYIPPYFEHTLVRCIGQAATVEVETARHTVAAGQRILLYTDGLTKAYKLDELHQNIMQASCPEALIESLVAGSNARGGIDNVTAIAVFLK